MTAGILWLQLAGAAAIILIASNFMAKAADVVALRTGLGRTFVGVVMLATATSLPELGTGVSSIVLLDAPDLAAGDAFGSNLFNLLIIGLMDTFWRSGPILTRVSFGSIVVAALGIIVIATAASAMIAHRLSTTFDGWYASPATMIMLGVFIVGMYIVYRFEQSQEQDGAEGEVPVSGSLPVALTTYGISASIVVVSAIWLASTGDRLSHVMGWDASFIGTQFLAASTSLPELAASFGAMRLGAPDLAISNVLGSNLFNMASYCSWTIWSTPAARCGRWCHRCTRCRRPSPCS